MLCQVGRGARGQFTGSHFHRRLLLHGGRGRVGYRRKAGGERRRVDSGVWGCHDIDNASGVLGAKELRGQSNRVLSKGGQGRGRSSDNSIGASVLGKLVGEQHVGPLNLAKLSLEFLVPLHEGFGLEPLAFTGRLGGAAVTENTLDTTLFLFIFGLGPFPECSVRIMLGCRWCKWGGLPGREVCLGLREDLTPGLALLGRLLLGRRV